MNDVLIFILDDDMEEAEEIATLLKEDGFPNCRIFTLSVTLLDNIDPNARIFIVDYKLDNLNGLQVIEKIKKLMPHSYFIMLSGMKNYSIVEQFCNTVIRGRYVTKGEPTTGIKVLNFVREFIEDMNLMRDFYLKRDAVVSDMNDIKKIMKGGNDAA